MKNRYTNPSYASTGILLVFLAFLPMLMSAAHYRTLQVGTYSNTTTVWSLDGVTPCACTPGPTVSSPGDTVSVLHNITLDQNLLFTGTTTLLVSNTAFLTGPFSISVDGASMTNEGGVLVVGLSVSNFGGVYGAGSFNIGYGNFTLTTGFARLSGTVNILGNVLNQFGSEVEFFSGAQVDVDGDYTNNAITMIHSGACLTIHGNFYSDYVIFGLGHILVYGDLTNYGDWDMGITWCVGGVAVNVPGTPTCTNCGPLPVVLKSFTGRHLVEESMVELKWETLVEIGSSGYKLERSNDGTEFFEVAQIKSATANDGSGSYTWTEEASDKGIRWYRLIQIDLDGAEKAIGTLQVNVSVAGDFTAKAYPNPFNGMLNLAAMSGETTNTTISIHSVAGQKIYETEIDPGSFSMNLPTQDWAPGIYLVEFRSGSHFKSVRLVKQ